MAMCGKSQRLVTRGETAGNGSDAAAPGSRFEHGKLSGIINILN
jgi:hypothetical protein